MTRPIEATLDPVRAGHARRAGLAAPAPAPPDVAAAVARVCARVAPLWPLRSFVAVNPFLGVLDEPFPDACARMARVTGAAMLMPPAFYRAAMADGRITGADLQAALHAARGRQGVPASVAALLDALGCDDTPEQPAVQTVAEVAGQVRGAPLASLVTRQVAAWCGTYWDAGQAAWQSPCRGLRPYPAWRAAALHDRTPDAMGLAGFRRAVAVLPDDPAAMAAAAVTQLGLSSGAVEPYLHRALASIGGWAAYARHLTWTKALDGEADDTLAHLLAIRLAWDAALLQLHPEQDVQDAWRAAAAAACNLEVPRPATAAAAILQDAYERAFQRGLLRKLTSTPASQDGGPQRPAVQAAFCIDVRSEVYRRALESTSPGVETLGFAGFFGFPIEYVPLGSRRGTAQCPVLLRPKFTVCEAVSGATPAEEAGILGRRILRRRLARAWRAFKSSAVSSFPFVETVGLLSGAKLVSDSAGLTRTVAHPGADALDPGVPARTGPRLDAAEADGRRTGFAPDERVAMAAAVLRGMSLTQGFARLVLLVGHGSTTVNNPHAGGLDCGACGGHTGEANARVAAAILNDSAVRTGLRAAGIAVPDDTWFVAALHDTTTDAVMLFDAAGLPGSHAADAAQLRAWMQAASDRTRQERAAALGLPRGANVRTQVARRSRDWSEVRPEWGLAGNAAFIAAPRSRTRGTDLGGRAFLHSYDWRDDGGFGVLELIMTAPMVVASWINLQYYGSVVDNAAFGCGDKTLHNVTGLLGVVEGNGGDLRTGLPWQSVHDGQRLMHEPRRLSVVLAAPEAAINGVLERHPAVRQLADNGWLTLFRQGDGSQVWRYVGGLCWEEQADDQPAPTDSALAPPSASGPVSRAASRGSVSV